MTHSHKSLCMHDFGGWMFYSASTAGHTQALLYFMFLMSIEMDLLPELGKCLCLLIN